MAHYAREVEFRELVLEKRKYRAMVPIPGSLWRDPEAISFVADIFIDQIVAVATWQIPGKRFAARSVQVPDGWWQAIKAEVFPAWLRHRFPPRMRSIDVEIVKVAPQLDFPKDAGRLFRFLQFENDDGS